MDINANEILIVLVKKDLQILKLEEMLQEAQEKLKQEPEGDK